MKSIVEYFDKTVISFPNKVSFIDSVRESTFIQTQINAKKIATFLSAYGIKRAVVIYIDKSCNCIDTILGSLYAGDYYIVCDINSPKERLIKIMEILDQPIIVVDSYTINNSDFLRNYGIVLQYENIIKTNINESKLSFIKSKIIDLDVAYILFTSGSTGIPKGTVISHKSLMSYIDWFTNEFDIDENTIFGSQTPLFFSMSISDFYSTIKCGCTYNIISKSLFMFPLKIVELLNDKKINTIYWVPTAISILSNWKVFDILKPLYLKKVMFAGEIMPTKQLNYWINNLNNDIEYANLFGPTETTDICTFYKIDRKFEDKENLPIGRHCENCDTFIIKEDGKLANVNEEGELYVRSSFMANGYYRNETKTKEVFIQNPLNDAYPERVYKTGDLVKLNDRNEIIYISRKDFQIKRNGYRIELGEIESNVNSIDNINSCACVYNNSLNCLALFYEGGPKDSTLILNELRNNVPSYMIPDEVIRLKEMPKNANGKIDRNILINEILKYIRR